MSDTLMESEDQNARLIGSPNEDADWCDDCHGYTHAPWCPAYKSGKEAAEHEPAARGGGDEWYTDSQSSTDATIYARTGRQWVGQVHARFADQIVREHNSYQSLVAERDTAHRAIAYLVLNGIVNADQYWPDEIAEWAHELMAGEQRTGVQLVREVVGQRGGKR